MDYVSILMAYNDLKNGKTTRDDILEMYKVVEDKAATHRSGETLLHLAAANIHAEAIAYLLAEGADVGATNDADITPLWSVALRRDWPPTLPERAAYDATAALLEAGASPMKKDSEGNWCYLVAAKNGNGEFIAALHDRGVRITRTDGGGNNGLHLLIESLYNPINDFERYESRLRKSTESGASESTLENDKRLLTEARAKMDYRLGMAFMGAVALLDAGVDPEDKNNMGETAHKLAERRGAKKIGALLRGEIGGGDADGGDETAALRAKAGGMTLHAAVGKRDEEAIRALVALGADVNEIGDIYGYGEGTPLAMALRSGDLPSTQLLLELGADPNVRAGNGTTALSWFACPRTGNIEKMFKENHPAKIVAALVAAGLDIDGAVDDRSNTLLTWALRESHDMEMFLTRETLRWYLVGAALVQGADVNKSNLQGQTALMLASAGNPHFNMRMADEIQLLLLEKGADVAAKDRDGNTPLLYVAQNGDATAAKEMAENLFDYGDPLIYHTNNGGKSALDIATEKDNEMLVKLLLNYL